MKFLFVDIRCGDITVNHMSKIGVAKQRLTALLVDFANVVYGYVNSNRSTLTLPLNKSGGT